MSGPLVAEQIPNDCNGCIFSALGTSGSSWLWSPACTTTRSRMQLVEKRPLSRERLMR